MADYGVGKSLKFELERAELGSNYQKMKVGDNSVVGMSSVVIKSVPSNSTVFGFPAKAISK